ncbi:putative 2-aminoethylphosphonate ABC transporter substrate-binding protein [Litoribrevibacter albus]|uniref:2-aminoethylphosphonate ABC transporter substrate-binding protein n=1 Tax=Litoribrevibacter albus TaxID=1473156 RepID=A0AA37S8W5_9GAMM|nr:putative 2-aminoethylphosphonate ABC transporter substrate-binding protein [Litoribrevibacter albus]GLQ30711.1 putative 2-aminoethylphosphonate ABC transporter substrate-binding protein [Litoribrevibacter albus]
MSISTQLKTLCGAVLAGSALLLTGCGNDSAETTQASNEPTELTVYTALEADLLDTYGKAFTAEHPDIKINWVRDSTGTITAKLLAEKENPRADVVWGLAGTSLLKMKSEGMLESYSPIQVEKLDEKFRDTSTNPAWVGMDAWVAAICFNTVEAEKYNLSKPTSWQDLTKPEYKGHVIMPNPNSSGTGFLDVSSWLQTFGEDKGWQFMDGLHQNISRYTHSGSKPCKLAASGETAIGISFAYRGANLIKKGAPLELIIPSEGIGWEIEATAILNTTKKMAAAKKLVDWSITKTANELYNQGYAVVAYPGVAKPVEHFPAEVGEKMIKNDFEWAAKNRDKILSEWQKRYDSKSEPKS